MAQSFASSNTTGPVVEFTTLFPMQSYCDPTLGIAAIQPQPVASGIVQSTFASVQQSGYAIGLSPASQTPVAVQFIGGAGAGTSSTIHLTPGQIVRPSGLWPGQRENSFRGFNWGLPFGWLGGGLAQLLVFLTPDSDAKWIGRPEIIFHEFTTQITATLPAEEFNWPLRFPWPNAVQGTNANPQPGQPVLAVEPTRTLLRLRSHLTAAPAPALFIFTGTNDFDLDSTGAPTTTNQTIVPITFPVDTSGAVGNYYQAFFLPDEATRIAADEGGINIVDFSVGAPLAELYVDIVRYGRL